METSKDPKVWLITGCSRGIGKSIVEAALEAGDKVVATARQKSQIDHFEQNYPNQAIAVPLDVCDVEANQNAVDQAINRFGAIDILVNNAGYGVQGMIEEVSMQQVREQMETNFFGLLDLTQRCLPIMRKQGSGIIFNVSSIAGLRGTASFGAYNASKFAVNGFTEAMAQEVKQFGIQVSLVNPGPYKTDWAGDSLDRSSKMKNLDSESPYSELNADWKGRMDKNNGNQPGDPRQIANVLIDASRKESIPLHMFFGDFAVEAVKKRVNDLQDPEFCMVFPHEKHTL